MSCRGTSPTPRCSEKRFVYQFFFIYEKKFFEVNLLIRRPNQGHFSNFEILSSDPRFFLPFFNILVYF